MPHPISSHQAYQIGWKSHRIAVAEIHDIATNNMDIKNQSDPNSRTNGIRVGAIATLMTGFATSLLIMPPALANPYGACTSSLINAGLSESDAAAACAASLSPRDLSRCVTSISDSTAIAPEDVLSSCRRVRRPAELASCVVDINSGMEGMVALDVLDYCRRSVLPTQYSECVTGLSAETALPAAIALDTCVTADYARPAELPVDFVPVSDSP
jgi:hypothetical protein